MWYLIVSIPDLCTLTYYESWYQGPWIYEHEGKAYVFSLLAVCLLHRSSKGGTLIFLAYLGSGPASTIHPKKYQEFQALQKLFEILATQKNIPILYLDLKKRP